MALLAIFSRRDKSRPPPEPSKASTKTSSESRRSQQPDDRDRASVQTASSSKLILGLRGKRSNPAHNVHTDDDGFLRPPVLREHRLSSSRSDSGHDPLGPPPSRSELFSSYGTQSTRSLPAPERTVSRDTANTQANTSASTPNTEMPAKKSKSMFAWAHRDRKKSKAAVPNDIVTDDSFNLKSFRHVSPVSPGALEVPRPPSSLSTTGFTPPQRPRGSSVASADSSQRISVAAFREMAARRSVANSPSPSSTDLRPDGSPVIRPPSTFSQAVRTSPTVPGRRPGSRIPPSPSGGSTSSESESDDDDSAGSSTLRPRNRASRSEAGHRMKLVVPRLVPSTSNQGSVNSRESVYSRTRASQSTSALMPNAAAKRASVRAAANAPTAGLASTAPQKPKRKAASNSSSDSSSADSDSDSDNAPLVKYIMPKRPGSATSNTTSGSRNRPLNKPLIDITGLSPPPPLVSPESEVSPPLPKEVVAEAAQDKEKDKENIQLDVQPNQPEKEKPSPSPSTKPTLNDRLARLAQSVTSGRSSHNLNTQEFPRDDSRDKDVQERGRSPLPQPKRSQTVPMDSILPTQSTSSTSSPTEPPSPAMTGKPKPNGRSMSTPNAFEGIKDLSDPTPIVPTPIRQRSPPPAFSVTSRPASQLSLLSNGQSAGSRTRLQLSPQQEYQLPPRMLSPERSQSPTVSLSATMSISGASQASSESRPAPPLKPAPLIPDNGAHPVDGFTGSGLLASAIASPQSEQARNSPAPSSSKSPLIHSRWQSATVVPKAKQSPKEKSTIALKPPGAFQEPSFSRRNTGDDSSRTSGGDSASSVSATSQPPSNTSKTSVNMAQPRARSSTVASPSGSNSMAPPVKPFAGNEFRRNSPASSTGESSSGRTPITPRDGSELGYATRGRDDRAGQGGDATITGPPIKRSHRKSTGMALNNVDKERLRTAVTVTEREYESEEDGVSAETKRKERRRSEAIAALELGKIVNGRGPAIDEEDDEDRPLDNMPPRMSMLTNRMGVPPSGSANMGMNMMNMNMTPSTPMTPMGWPSQPGMMNPQQYMFPMVPPNADPSFLAAHQQAMMVAKQAYQMAVAQQAMAAAEEEWERGSTAAMSVLGGAGGKNSAFGVGPMAPMFPGPSGYGMPMGGMNGMGMGMQGGWPGMMFASSAQSMYAPSIAAGSEIGVSHRIATGWGSRSAYGDPNAGDRTSTFKTSGFGNPPMPPRSESQGTLGEQQMRRPGPRPRTRTAPSSGMPQVSGDGSRRPAPPSSWKTGGRPT